MLSFPTLGHIPMKMVSGVGIMRSIASALLDRGPALYLLSPLLPKSKLATLKGPGAEGLKDGTPFWLWATGPKKQKNGLYLSCYFFQLVVFVKPKPTARKPLPQLQLLHAQTNFPPQLLHHPSRQPACQSSPTTLFSMDKLQLNA